VIPTIFYPHAGAQCTLMYSHGNAVDLGILLTQGKLRGLRDELGVNVCTYDYPGYGLSVGPTNEETVYDALESYYHEVIRRYKIPPATIILYGRSMGSAPTIHLAAKLAEKKDSLCGIVIESGLLSILRTFGVFKDKTRWFDMFPNVDEIGKIRHPVYITHGRNDTVVPFWHAEELFRLATGYKEQHWIDGLGHNDMPDVWQYRDTPRQVHESEMEYKAKCEETKAQNAVNKEHKRRLKFFIQAALDKAQGLATNLSSASSPTGKSVIELSKVSATPSSPNESKHETNHDVSTKSGKHTTTTEFSPTSGSGSRGEKPAGSKTRPADLDSSVSKAESDSSDDGEV